MAAVYPDGVFNDPNTWPRARRLDALALFGGDTAPPLHRLRLQRVERYALAKNIWPNVSDSLMLRVA